MFVIILRISASNIPKMFINIIVSLGVQNFVIFDSYKPTGSTNTP